VTDDRRELMEKLELADLLEQAATVIDELRQGWSEKELHTDVGTMLAELRAAAVRPRDGDDG